MPGFQSMVATFRRIQIISYRESKRQIGDYKQGGAGSEVLVSG